MVTHNCTPANDLEAGRRLPWLALSAAALVAGLSLPLAAQSPSGAVAEGEPVAEATQWVRQLGDPSYVERERASRKLAAMGVDARPALMEALQADDEEVRYRARGLLLKILDDDLNSRIARFTADINGGVDANLPGWRPYRDLVGDSLDNRRLFVEIIRSEPLLMEALESSPQEATEALRIRANSLQQEMQQPQFFDNQHVPHRVALGTVVAFFLAAADEDVAIDENIGRIVQSILYQSSFQVDINSGVRAEPLRRMLGRWIVRNRSTTMAYQGLHFAMQYNLQEGRELAIHLIQAGGQPANLLQTALLVLGRFGDADDLKTVEPLLKDTSPVQFGANQENFQQEVRDIALAVAIHLSGQELREYGFSNAQPNPQMLYNPGTLTFTSPAMRDAAFGKWEAWRAKQPAATPGKS